MRERTRKQIFFFKVSDCTCAFIEFFAGGDTKGRTNKQKIIIFVTVHWLTAKLRRMFQPRSSSIRSRLPFENGTKKEWMHPSHLLPPLLLISASFRSLCRSLSARWRTPVTPRYKRKARRRTITRFPVDGPASLLNVAEVACEKKKNPLSETWVVVFLSRRCFTQL